VTIAEQLAAFVSRASFHDLSRAAVEQLKIRVLDAVGCAIGALGGDPIRRLEAHLEEFGGSALCTLVGGGRTAPDRAALYNGALVRYLDFNDSYLARGETCHPSDNLGAVLAASEYADRGGGDLLTALAVAYQVQCRLSDVAPVRARGFDHTTQGSYAVGAGVSKALGLDPARTANAIAICGTAFNALRVTRTGPLSHWKGLAYPNAAACCTQATFLAMRGITGPPLVFEGNKGFMEAIAGRFALDWARGDLERVTRTIVKQYNAEVHSQATLEGVLELRREDAIRPEDIEQVEIETFDVAYNIIGGGEEGDKTLVRTKEEADHSLPYLVAVALIDGQVLPEQYAPDRITRPDVQSLLRRVVVRATDAYSQQFPGRMPCRIRITTRGGRVFERDKQDYEGFHTRPMRWSTVVQKFDRLSAPCADAEVRREIVGAVAELEGIRVRELTRLLARVRRPG